MTTMNLKDNSVVKKDDLKDILNLTRKIEDKTLEQLKTEGIFVFPDSIKDANDITKEQILLQSVNDNYRISNVMGFLGYGKERLVIESRFSKGNQDYFFRYLLERVLDFPNILELNTDSNPDNKIFNLLLFLFPKYLKAALRKGVYKTYIRKQYNDSNIKGSIDIARHITTNIPFTDKVAYNQREFSYDNDMMELLRHTIEFIKMKSYGYKLLNIVKDEVSAVVKSTPSYAYCERKSVIMKNQKHHLRHAYFYEYRELQRLCIMILRHEKHQIDAGIREVNGILFDGAWLWEEYINSLIQAKFYHPMNKGGKGAQRLFPGNIGLIYPDFISRDAENRIIADAKYKPIENIGNKDYLQVLAYMFRFDAKKGYYLYPENSSSNIQCLQLNSGSSYEKNVFARDDISIIKYGLHIPAVAENYESFKIKIRENEKVFVSQLEATDD